MNFVLVFCCFDSKLLNAIKPGTINDKLICRKPNPNVYEKTQNHVLAIEGLKRLASRDVVNIGPNDLLNGTVRHLSLSVWYSAYLSLSFLMFVYFIETFASRFRLAIH
jgi:hypothetical protein